MTVRNGKYIGSIKERDLARKYFSKFNHKFYHFECTALEMFMVTKKWAFNNY